MDKKKFQSLLSNEEFMKKILQMKTAEEVQAEFKKDGVEISLEEVGILGSLSNKSIEKGGKPLSEEDLSEIAGGEKEEKTSDHSSVVPERNADCHGGRPRGFRPVCPVSGDQKGAGGNGNLAVARAG